MDAYRSILDRWFRAEQTAIFCDTAVRLYRIAD